MSHRYQVPILMYHKVERHNRGVAVPGHYVSPGLFKRHMSLLGAMGYSTIHLASLYCDDLKLPRKPIAITFDDGYANFMTNALPVLKSQRQVATVFLVANQIGGTNAWDAKEGGAVEQLLSLDQIMAARAAGTEFGSHTLDHADLTAVDPMEAWRQISESKSNLESRLGFAIECFCYPYGRKNHEVRKMVEAAGYALACSTDKGVNIQSTDRFALKRTNIRRDTTIPIFVMKLLRGRRNGR